MQGSASFLIITIGLLLLWLVISGRSKNLGPAITALFNGAASGSATPGPPPPKPPPGPFPNVPPYNISPSSGGGFGDGSIPAAGGFGNTIGYDGSGFPILANA